LGWPGHSKSQDVAFGSIIDLLAKNPPCDIAVVRFRRRETPQRILIPTAGGLHTRLAIELAIAQAHQYKRWHPAEPSPTITLMTVVSEDAPANSTARAREMLHTMATGVDYPLEKLAINAPDVITGILAESEKHTLVVIGATAEGLFEQRLFGSIPQRVARKCDKTVIMVKRYEGPVRSWVKRVLLLPNSSSKL
jgi:nucleotide-binding universal stress UspA family protein